MLEVRTGMMVTEPRSARSQVPMSALQLPLPSFGPFALPAPPVPSHLPAPAETVRFAFNFQPSGALGGPGPALPLRHCESPLVPFVHFVSRICLSFLLSVTLRNLALPLWLCT